MRSNIERSSGFPAPGGAGREGHARLVMTKKHTVDATWRTSGRPGRGDAARPAGSIPPGRTGEAPCDRPRPRMLSSRRQGAAEAEGIGDARRKGHRTTHRYKCNDPTMG